MNRRESIPEIDRVIFPYRLILLFPYSVITACRDRRHYSFLSDDYHMPILYRFIQLRVIKNVAAEQGCGGVTVARILREAIAITERKHPLIFGDREASW